MAERMIDVDGVPLCAEAFGNAADPPILLVMGMGGSMLWWEEGFCRALAGGGRFVIRYDHRDTGRSVSYPPGAPGYTGDDLIADAVGVLDALGIARAHVLGVSMGGMIAQEMAIRWPERVDRLVVAVSFARPDPVRRAFLLFRRWSRLGGADLVQEGVANLPWLVSPRVLNDPERLERFLAIVGVMPLMSAEAYALQVEAILEHDTLSRLGGVRAPTLVLAAAEDVLTPIFLSREIAAAIPGATLTVLPRGNHAVQLEDPDAFNTAVLEFLAG
jgi:pimeloyl-ACP methyl ester carboxylesterase